MELCPEYALAMRTVARQTSVNSPDGLARRRAGHRDLAAAATGWTPSAGGASSWSPRADGRRGARPARGGLTRQKVDWTTCVSSRPTARARGEHAPPRRTLKRAPARRDGSLLRRGSPAALGDAACDPGRARDRLSARYLAGPTRRAALSGLGTLARRVGDASHERSRPTAGSALRSPADRPSGVAEHLAADATAPRGAVPRAPSRPPAPAVVGAHPIPDAADDDRMTADVRSTPDRGLQGCPSRSRTRPRRGRRDPRGIHARRRSTGAKAGETLHGAG